MDRLSNTDAFAVVYLTKPPPPPTAHGLLTKSSLQESEEIGRTTVVYDTENPDFETTFKVHYHFEENQLLTVKIFDEDKKGSSTLSDHDYIGFVSVTLGHVMGSDGNVSNSGGVCMYSWLGFLTGTSRRTDGETEL